jgi:hypothetical protein
MSLVLGGGLDVVGDGDVDGEGLVTLGAASHAIRVPTPRWMRGATSQGVSRPHEELDFLPFEPVTLIAGGSGAANGFLIARPQRPFRGERLVMTATKTSDGSDASGATVIDPAIYVGAVQVGAAQGGTPIIAFGATAFGVRLSVPAAGQGTDIKIFVRSLLSAAESVVTAVLFGRAVR